MTNVSVQMITPSLAMELLSGGMIYDRQRRIASEWVKYLADEMKLGSFKQDTSIEIAKRDDNGQRVLLDGYHRLTAVVQSGIPSRFVIIETTVRNLDDVNRAYYRIDQNKKRGPAEQVRALGLDQEYHLTKTQSRRLVSAVALIDSGWFDIRPMHFNERERMFREYAEACGMYFATTSGRISELKSPMERSSTLSVGVVTFRFSSQKLNSGVVETFWEGVAFDDGIASDDPRKIAHRHLLTTDIAQATGYSDRRTVSAAYSARVIAACFNAYAKGKTMRSEPKPAMEPMEIYGSPFNGK